MGCGCGGGRSSFSGRSSSRGFSSGGGSMGTPVSFNNRAPTPGEKHAPRSAPQHIVQSAALAQRRAQTRRMV